MDRTYITPIVNQTYTNRNGSEYRCTSVAEAIRPCETTALFTRVRDGWSLQAHGILQYDDGTIEWNYSTGGTGPGNHERRDNCESRNHAGIRGLSESH